MSSHSSTSPPPCSIVIRAFNEEEHIGRLLTGISQQTVEAPETILVDSGSTDATVAIASKFPVRFVEISPEEFTFGRSLNRGIAAASGEFIVIISAHCFPVYPDWLERLLEPFEDAAVAAAYGKQRGGKTNHYSEHQFFRQYFPDLSQLNQGQPFTHNANAAIRKKLWEEHPYNEQLTGLEDLAWSSWAKGQGYRLSYVAEAEVVHVHDETYAQVYNRYKREAIALKQILPESRFTLRDMISMSLRKILSDSAQARREKVLGEYAWSILRFRFLQYLATWFGYRYAGKIDAQLHQQFYYPPDILSGKVPERRDLAPIDYQSKLMREK